MSEVLETVVTIRQPKPDDISFLFSSWLKSYRNSPWAKPMHNNVYFDYHHALIQDLLNHSEVYIACSKKNGSDIYGYAVGQWINDVFTLHYVYVKHAYRRLGIGKLLMACFNRGEFAGCYTHHTHMASKLADKFALLYNPYLLSLIDSQEELIVPALESAVNNDELPINIEPEVAPMEADNGEN